MPSIAHVFSAAALVASLSAPLLSASDAVTEPVTPPQPVCYSPEMVVAKIGEQPRFDLKDEELEAFNQNFKIKLGATPPQNDELMVFGKGETDEQILLLVSFKAGCVISASQAPAGAFLKVLQGNRA